jgi:predicted RNA-binding protein
MCESKVFLLEGGEKRRIMDDVIKVKSQANDIILIGLLGEIKEIKNGRIVEVDAERHEVIVESRAFR